MEENIDNEDINMNSDDMLIDMPKNIIEKNTNSNNNTSNSLQFFPYSNNTLTRSAATLNLSLTRSDTLQNITEETLDTFNKDIGDSIGDVDVSIKKWSPFRPNKIQQARRKPLGEILINRQVNTTQHKSKRDSIESIYGKNVVPSTPVTRIKRTASKSEMSPSLQRLSVSREFNNRQFTNNTTSSTKQEKYALLVDAATNQVLKEENMIPPTINISYDSAVPNPNAFGSLGLRSKLKQPDALYPKKLSIPKTPVKRHPLKDSSQLNNSNNNNANSINENTEFSNDNEVTSFTRDSTAITNSPTIRTPKIVIASVEESSPLSSSRGSAHSKQRNSPYFNLNKYKKLKKSRDSVIMKNMELTNSLQQFTNDLYGTIDTNQISINEDLVQLNRSESPNPLNFNSNNTTNNLSFFENDNRSNNSNTEQLERFRFEKNSNENMTTNVSNSIAAQQDNDEMKDFSTPTRKKSIIGATSHTQIFTQFNQDQFQITQDSPSQLVRGQGNTIETSENPDSHLVERFTNVTLIDQGNFSKVYQVTFEETNTRYAIKSISINKRNNTKKILQEIKLLAHIRDKTESDQEGKEYVIDFISSWKFQTAYYVMTEFYENGNLDTFLNEQIIKKSKRLEDWRIWKIIVEMGLALRFIHDSCHIVHLDLKPANIMITFEGTLKLVDFGMATCLPLDDHDFENEGDREYIAPEIISDAIYDFRADIFSLGLIIVEIAANVVLPDNGNAWHKLRSGDLSDAGGLSSTDIHSESLFSTSTKFDTNVTDMTNFHTTSVSTEEPLSTANCNLTVSGLGNNNRYEKVSNYNNMMNSSIPAWVPKFLIDGESLERTVKWMIDPDYRRRPTANQLLHTEECMYVEMTRLTGAIIQEDDFGPKPKFFM